MPTAKVPPTLSNSIWIHVLTPFFIMLTAVHATAEAQSDSVSDAGVVQLHVPNGNQRPRRHCAPAATGRCVTCALMLLFLSPRNQTMSTAERSRLQQYPRLDKHEWRSHLHRYCKILQGVSDSLLATSTSAEDDRAGPYSGKLRAPLTRFQPKWAYKRHFLTRPVICLHTQYIWQADEHDPVYST